jgi:hypothetical protein
LIEIASLSFGSLGDNSGDNHSKMPLHLERLSGFSLIKSSLDAAKSRRHATTRRYGLTKGISFLNLKAGRKSKFKKAALKANRRLNYESDEESVTEPASISYETIEECDSWLDDLGECESAVKEEPFTLEQAQSLVALIEDELRKQKEAKVQVAQRFDDDLMKFQARRSYGCRRGFLLSRRRMKRHQGELRRLGEVIQFLDTLRLVLSIEISQVQAIAALSGEKISHLQVPPSMDTLREEVEYILGEMETERDIDDDELLLIELKTTVALKQ